MDKSVSKLTVYFEVPFWVGVYERQRKTRYEVCKITFGSEPKDGEIYEFILKNWSQLTFSPSIKSSVHKEQRINPKRMKRNIHKELHQEIGTKAQNALKLQQEQRIQVKKKSAKERRNHEDARLFALRQEKKKAKHKGH